MLKFIILAILPDLKSGGVQQQFSSGVLPTWS